MLFFFTSDEGLGFNLYVTLFFILTLQYVWPHFPNKLHFFPLQTSNLTTLLSIIIVLHISQMLSLVLFIYFSTILDLFASNIRPSSFCLSSFLLSPIWLLPLSWQSSFQHTNTHTSYLPSLLIRRHKRGPECSLSPLVSTTPRHSRCNPTLGRIWGQGRGRSEQTELDACARAKAEQLSWKALLLFVCEKCARQMMRGGPRLQQMKFELASRNTQQDKTTTLNHADGRGRGLDADGAQDVSSEEQDARGSAFKPRNDKQTSRRRNKHIHKRLQRKQRGDGGQPATCKITIELTICDGRGSYRGHHCWTGHKKSLCCNVAICWQLFINAWQQPDIKPGSFATVWHNKTYSISREPHETTKTHYAFWYLNNMPSCIHSGITLQHDSSKLCHLLAQASLGSQSQHVIRAWHQVIERQTTLSSSTKFWRGNWQKPYSWFHVFYIFTWPGLLINPWC